MARCVFFAAVPAALLGPVLRFGYAAAHVDMVDYAQQTSMYVYPYRVWLAVVLCVALGPALNRDRVETVAIAALATIVFSLMDGLRGKLWLMLI